MYKISFFIAFVALAGFVAGCDSSISSMSEDEPRIVASKTANGATVDRVQIVSFFYAPCLSDFIKLEGEGHIVRRTSDASGTGGYHVIENLSYHLEGMGLLTGDRYVVQQALRRQETDRVDFGSTMTSTSHYRFIKPGSGLVMNLRSMEHLTVNANGEITVELKQHVFECSP